MSLTLIIGGTRSGKSRRAEDLAHASGVRVRYVATADGTDPLMAERIRLHAARRPSHWEVIDADGPLDLVVATDGPACVLLDGLGPWIAGVLHRAGAFDDPDPDILEAVRRRVLDEVCRMAAAAAHGSVAVIVVAEEAGLGLLPPDSGSRMWLDLLGESTQRIAALAQRVELVMAGRATPLTGVVTTDGTLAGLRHHGDRDIRPGDADHAVNVMSGGPPAWLREALRSSLEGDIDRYPDETAAVSAIAGLHGREPAEVVPTNGGAEALWLLATALRPTLAVCVHPGFTEAEAALRINGVPVLRAHRDPERGFALDPASIDPAADLVVVGNPASPSGTLDPAAALLALRRPGRTVVVDEAFMDLVPGQPGSLVRDRLEDVIVIRSVTKALAVPGLRVGYAVAAPARAARLRDARPPWAANALALASLVATARHPEALAQAATRADLERRDLERRLAPLEGVRTWPSVTNFCLIEVDDGPGVVAALRDRRIAVRPAGSFPGLGPGYIRLTARGPDENSRLVAAIRRAVAA